MLVSRRANVGITDLFALGSRCRYPTLHAVPQSRVPTSRSYPTGVDCRCGFIKMVLGCGGSRIASLEGKYRTRWAGGHWQPLSKLGGLSILFYEAHHRNLQTGFLGQSYRTGYSFVFCFSVRPEK